MQKTVKRHIAFLALLTLSVFLYAPWTIAASPPDQYESNDTLASATVLYQSTPGQTLVYATLHSTSDLDWYRVYIPANRMLVIDMYDISAGTNGTLGVYNGSGNLLAPSAINQAPDNEPEHVVYVTAYEGFYYIRVGSTQVGTSSAYTLSICAMPNLYFARPTISASRVTWAFDMDPIAGRTSCFRCYPNLCSGSGLHAYDTHSGTDYGWHNDGTAGWDTVYSCVAGTVTLATYDSLSGYYLTVTDATYDTMYMHLRNSSHFVAVGNNVVAGQRLSYMGATGNVFGKHLHLVTRNKTTKNRFCPYYSNLMYRGAWEQ